MFVIDTNKEAIAIDEAKRLGIPVVAIIDSNCDPDQIDYPIPGNDDAARAISLYCDLIARAAIDGIARQQGASGCDLGASAEAPVEPTLERSRRADQSRRRTARCARSGKAAATAEVGGLAVSGEPRRFREFVWRVHTLSRIGVHSCLNPVAAPAGAAHAFRTDKRQTMTTLRLHMVKELREKTGAGMMDCKTALTETNGDMEAAIDWLRAKGISKADKKSGRTAAEGLIGIAGAGHKAVVVEVNSETDFVARNDAFQDIVRNVAKVALDTDGTVEAVAAATYPASGKSVTDTIKDAIGTIGENMTLRRSAMLSVERRRRCDLRPQRCRRRPRQARRSRRAEVDRRQGRCCPRIGRQVAMHVAATNPLALTAPKKSMPAVAERERRRLHRAGPRIRQAGERSSRRWSKAACASSSRKSFF